MGSTARNRGAWLMTRPCGSARGGGRTRRCGLFDLQPEPFHRHRSERCHPRQDGSQCSQVSSTGEVVAWGGSMRSRGIAVRRIWLAMLALGLAASFASGQAIAAAGPTQRKGRARPIAGSDSAHGDVKADSVSQRPWSTPKIAKSPNPPPAIPARSLPIAGSDIELLKPLPIPPMKAAATEPSRLRAGPARTFRPWPANDRRWSPWSWQSFCRRRMSARQGDAV